MVRSSIGSKKSATTNIANKRRYRFPRVVDCFLVTATPEPLISCGLAGSAQFRGAS
jgi:hypothetical protein